MADRPVAARSSRTDRQAAKLEVALSGLETMDLEALRAHWQAVTGQNAPATFRIPLLRAAVAYKLQEQVHDGLKAGTRRLLHRVADAADSVRRGRVVARPAGPSSAAEHSALSTIRGRAPAAPLRIKPGTRLLRTWQGSTHEVLVGDNGVTYRGLSYRSLSEVARLITGQRWSGPLFFGLKLRTLPAAASAMGRSP